MAQSDQQAQVVPQAVTAVILDQSTAVILDPASLPPAFGHGTMVAGIVHLAAPTAQILPLKAFSGDGSAHLFDILRALYYAVDHNAHVINMSFSLLQPSAQLTNAIGFAVSSGIICVAAAGNTGTAFVASPAALPKVLAVASTSNQDIRSSFSSYGAPVFVAAPGEGVITTYPGNNYAEAWGTSFSAPFVAGAAALVVQNDPAAEYSDANKAISHADTLTPDLGYGRLDLYQAIKAQLKD